MSKKWIVIGVSGVTCGGKTTLAKFLLSKFPGSIGVNQDNYFHPPDSPHHILVKELGHLNWEILSALDMEAMVADVKQILSQDPQNVILPEKIKSQTEMPVRSEIESVSGESYPFILILEGFLIFNHPELLNMCDCCYYVTLTKEQCWERRKVRTYSPPDVPGYFDLVTWPEYVRHRDVVLGKDVVTEIDGTTTKQLIFERVEKEIAELLKKRSQESN